MDVSRTRWVRSADGTEWVTLHAGGGVSDAEYERVAQHFSADEIAALLSLIVLISAWNALAVTTRSWLPGSYRPRGGPA